jgi:hypothetical protein
VLDFVGFVKVVKVGTHTFSRKESIEVGEMLGINLHNLHKMRDFNGLAVRVVKRGKFWAGGWWGGGLIMMT